jgi:hypothetical protein
MSGESENQLKVCCTCSSWSFQHKGFCHRLEQGAGKFWMCEDWSSAAAAEAEESLPGTLSTAQVGGTLG